MSYFGKKPIVCLGIVVADIVGYPLKALPEQGRLTLVNQMGLYTGGCAVNAATALARWGMSVEIVGKIGADMFGEFILRQLEERGIGTGGISRDQEHGTSATMVMVDSDGERSFVHYIGANASLKNDDVDFDMVKRASIVHVAGALAMPGFDGEPTAQLLKKARSFHVITFLDTVWDATGRWMEVLKPCLPHLDYFVPNLAEAQALTGFREPEDVAQALIDHGVGTVGLKMGDKGCLVKAHTDGFFRIPAYKVHQVIDSTGAGDAFAAGFIAGVWQGWPLDKTCRFANAAAALCVTALGATNHIGSLQETISFMEKNDFSPDV